MMADTPETPDAPAEQAKPTPRRRAASRPSDTTKPRVARKGAIAKVESVASRATATAKDAVSDGADKAVKAVKPRSSKRATPPAKRAGKKEPTRSAVAKATDRIGGTWGAAAIVTGVAGVATAALLTLRGSTRVTDGVKKLTGAEPTKHAHQADGTDSSASFDAGIADEGTIPESA